MAVGAAVRCLQVLAVEELRLREQLGRRPVLGQREGRGEGEDRGGSGGRGGGRRRPGEALRQDQVDTRGRPGGGHGRGHRLLDSLAVAGGLEGGIIVIIIIISIIVLTWSDLTGIWEIITGWFLWEPLLPRG